MSHQGSLLRGPELPASPVLVLVDFIYLLVSQVLGFDVLHCFWSIFILNDLVGLIDGLIDFRFADLVSPASAIFLRHCGSSPHTWGGFDLPRVEVGLGDQERAKPVFLELVP